MFWASYTLPVIVPHDGVIVCVGLGVVVIVTVIVGLVVPVGVGLVVPVGVGMPVPPPPTATPSFNTRSCAL
ncbi:MAG TPA: hypothetical protein PL043_05625, partial [Methanolinea sp.]|nr:hypothetical protein [Methanolinea sp.]